VANLYIGSNKASHKTKYIENMQAWGFQDPKKMQFGQNTNKLEKSQNE
jgi:hypothetical protein